MDEDFDLKFDRKLSKFLRRARFVIRLACFLIVAYIGYTVAMSGRDTGKTLCRLRSNII